MIAITGATGLLGGHILSRFREADVPITALHRPGHDASLPEGTLKKIADVLDPVLLNDAFQNVNTVIHSAAFVSFNPRKRKVILDVNVKGTQHVVDACLQQGVKNLIHISSVAALGRKSGMVVNENSIWTGDISSDYAESKYLAELEVFRGAEEGLVVSMVSPSVILSATQLTRSSATIFDYVWQEKKFFTDGALNYVDARDVAEAVFRLHQNPQPGEKFILSAGSIPIQEFFHRTAILLKKRKPSIKISSSIAYWAGWVEEMRSLLFNREPLVTRLSASMAVQSFRYDSKKAEDQLGLKFRTLEESLNWCCEDFLRNVKANK